MQKFLIGLGIAIILLGVLWPLLSKMGLGRLPGDINVEREGFRFHFPIVTSLLISVALTALVALWMWFRNK
jgi:hypothetical protein